MEKILSLRRKIDEIDEQILRFLKERVEVCRSIGKTKREQGISVRDYEREDELYANVMRIASELGLNPHEVKDVYREIIAMGIRAQESETKT
ncbi:MAG: bifunctional chorismate mutase/prephenate dehydrogenase [Candidatus Bathyarchaeota archaeon BA2]|nr:MAG: bifunctional chorismate mutase/prephenate dehydrogenase [Candidatus Bathyarchaeota archaeon BA2]